MKSAETVINWTTGKVLAPHRACPPATASITMDVALLLRVPVCLWPHWNLAAEGILLYGYFFFLFKDSPRGQAETNKPKVRTYFSNVVLCRRFHQPNQVVLTLTSECRDWVGLSKNFLRCLNVCIKFYIQMLLNVANVSKPCFLSHCASLQLNCTCSHYHRTRLGAKSPPWCKINLWKPS